MQKTNKTVAAIIFSKNQAVQQAINCTFCPKNRKKSFVRSALINGKEKPPFYFDYSLN
jgi:hypothetical protein